jgi:hypothetical protein
MDRKNTKKSAVERSKSQKGKKKLGDPLLGLGVLLIPKGLRRGISQIRRIPQVLLKLMKITLSF